MLKYIESFDHLGAGTLGTTFTHYTTLGWSIPAGSVITSGTGKLGTNSLSLVNDGVLCPPTIPRYCNKLILGASISGYGGMRVDFYSGTCLNFSIHCDMNAHSLTVGLCTGLPNYLYHSDSPFSYYHYLSSNYTPISTLSYIPTVSIGTLPHFIEMSVDVTDYMNGSAKVSVDGISYIDISGIITAAYNVFGSDPYDPRAKLDRVKINFFSSRFWAQQRFGSVNAKIDCLYLADDDGGYQNDFLGDVFVRTIPPVSDGTAKRNWIPYSNSTQMADDFPHHDLVADMPLAVGSEATYIEADLDLTEELFNYGSSLIPTGSEIIAVNHRTLFRNVAIGGSPKMNSLVPLIQTLGNPIIATDSLARKLSGWSYSYLNVMYPIMPVSALQWTNYLLEGVEFGFMLRNAEIFFNQNETFDLTDEVTEE